MKWEKLRNLPFLLKQILSFSLVYIFPLAILLLVIYHNFSDYRDNINQSTQSAIENFTMQLDQDILSMQEITTSINTNGYADLLREEKKEYGHIELVSILHHLRLGKNDITEVGIWSEQKRFLICSSGTYEPEFFEQYTAPGITPALQKKLFRSDSVHAVQIDAQNGGCRILYTFPLQKNGTEGRKSIFFILDVDQILQDRLFHYDLLKDLVFWQQSQNDSRILLHANPDEDPLVLIRQLNPGQTIQQVSSAQGSLLGFLGKSEYMQHQMLFLFQSDALYSGLNTLWKSIILILGIYTAVGVALICILVWCNYKPMNRIFNYCAKRADPEPVPKVKNASLIYDTFASMEDQLENAAPIVKAQVAAELLHGSDSTDNSICTLALEKGVIQKDCAYAVLGVSAPVSLKQLRQETERYTADRNHPVYTTVTQDRLHKRFAILCSISGEPEQTLTNLEAMLLNLAKGLVTVGRSEVYPEPEDFSYAYLEAMTALSFQFVRGTDCVILYRNIKDINTGYSAKLETDIERMLRDLSLKKAERLEHCPDELIYAINSEALPLYQIKKAVNEIVNAYVKLCIDYHIDYQQYFDGYYDFEQGAGFETVQDVRTLLKTLGAEIIIKLQQEADHDEHLAAEALMQYVQQNALRSDFSIDAMADYFGISYTSLSTSFKQHHHVTIQNIKNNLRVQKAKELLETTNMSIQDVASAVGYDNPTSFIRMFKKMNGMTPMDYRKTARSGETAESQ